MIAVRSKIYKFRTIGSNEGNIMYWEKVSNFVGLDGDSIIDFNA